MAEKGTFIPLSKALLKPDGSGVDKTHINIILQNDFPVLCINKTANKRRLMPFKVLYENNNIFWRQGGNWQYYLTEENLEMINAKAAAQAPEHEKAKTADDNLEELPVEPGYGNKYKFFADMTNVEKIEYIDKDRERLNELISQKSQDAAVVTEALVDTAKDAAIINHVALEEAIKLADDEAKKLTQELVNSTHEMVKASAQLMTMDVFSNELMNTLVQKSNGTIVQHMTRVYLNGISFLSFYNNLVSTSSAIHKLRITFASRYREFYKSLLPHIHEDNITLERVFYGGMRAISPDLYFKWAVGFLLHDVGKASAVEYHEGEASYDRNIVIDHVKQGYKSILNKTNYPMEASIITGYHHEYYGDSAGYGYFRAYLQQYKRQNPDAKQDYCITYDLEPILDYTALAYFPAKVLEIIDIYDSITDPHRVYRKALSPEEAIAMMYEEFIIKHQKIDAILFDIFAAFIREQEALKNKDN